MKHLDKVILDADICFRLGRYSKINVFNKIIPNIANKVYIHEYVYENELRTEDTGKRQLETLANLNQLIILNENKLTPLQHTVYQSIVTLLCKVMKGTTDFYDREHKGEILSLAMAKTLRIPIFMTNEMNLQPIIDLKLNTGSSDDIHVFRLIDLIYWIKENPSCGIQRKEAKIIWCGAYDKKKLAYYKGKFDNEIWPIDA